MLVWESSVKNLCFKMIHRPCPHSVIEKQLQKSYVEKHSSYTAKRNWGGGVITIDEDGLQHLKQAQVLISGRYQW